MKLPDEVLKLIEKGKCVHCGNCCLCPPTVSRSEAENISKRLGLTLEEFKEKYLTYLRDEKLYMIKKTGHLEECVCMFLVAKDGKLVKGREQQSSCTIHDFKPLICELQFCGLSKQEREQLYKSVQNFVMSNVDYRWSI